MTLMAKLFKKYQYILQTKTRFSLVSSHFPLTRETDTQKKLSKISKLKFESKVSPFSNLNLNLHISGQEFIKCLADSDMWPSGPMNQFF